MKVKAHILFIFAAILWLIPGFIILKRGITTNFGVWEIERIIGAILVFLVFQFIIFRPIIKKHIERIHSYYDELTSIKYTFTLPTYLVILFFMSLGIVLRITHWAPDSFIAFFYPGIGLALFIAGAKFASQLFVKKNEK